MFTVAGGDFRYAATRWGAAAGAFYRILDAHAPTNWLAVELGGGGGPTDYVAGTRVHIDNLTYVSERNATGADICVQGGLYAPVDWYINETWRHEGEVTPQRRSAHYGDTSAA